MIQITLPSEDDPKDFAGFDREVDLKAALDNIFSGVIALKSAGWSVWRIIRVVADMYEDEFWWFDKINKWAC